MWDPQAPSHPSKAGCPILSAPFAERVGTTAAASSTWSPRQAPKARHHPSPRQRPGSTPQNAKRAESPTPHPQSPRREPRISALRCGIPRPRAIQRSNRASRGRQVPVPHVPFRETSPQITSKIARNFLLQAHNESNRQDQRKGSAVAVAGVPRSARRIYLVRIRSVPPGKHPPPPGGPSPFLRLFRHFPPLNVST